jgi:benzoate membrane transport protein
MSDTAAEKPGGWFGIISSAATAVVVGFASTILLIMEAARAVGANPAQQASWAAALCFGMALTTFWLSWRHRMPIITAWSTPGAALIATSAGGISYPEAIGAFVVAGLLMAATALVTPLAKAIARIPAPIASAMLAGVLLRYTLGVPQAAQALPLYVLPLIVVFFALRLLVPVFAVPVVVGLGVIMAALGGLLGAGCCALGVTGLTFDMPVFTSTAIIGLGVPLYLVTMASQNLPGFAVLRAAGYNPPVKESLLVTGLASAVMAPSGSHAVNLAAITASLVTGPETHPDPAQRWKMAWPYLVLYGLVGLGAASLVGILAALPAALITAIAGLALFGPLMGSVTAMMREARDIESALVTFLVTASGLSLFGVGSAFWGLVAGLFLFGARHMVSLRA